MINLDFGEKRFQHDNLYWNFRLSGLQSALGISQINNLEKVIKSKIYQGLKYSNLLNKFDDYINIPLKKVNGVKNHFFGFMGLF